MRQEQEAEAIRSENYNRIYGTPSPCTVGTASDPYGNKRKIASPPIQRPANSASAIYREGMRKRFGRPTK